MPKLDFSVKEIQDYVKDRKERKHVFYDRTKEMAHALCVHADGLKPVTLLEARRPNEPLEVLQYRLSIWKAKTKPTISKVLSELEKIRRSEDWSIRYDNLEEFTRIAPEETLEAYLDTNYPFFGSVTNWAFTLVLRKQMLDPNAVCVVMPVDFEVQQNEFLQPYGTIYNSSDVIDYVEGDYCVLNNPLGATYYVKNEPVRGRSFYIITTRNIFRYDQVNSKNEFQLTLNIEHGLPEMPAFQLKGVIIDQVNNRFLYESRINAMLPDLDELVRKYSDSQAAYVMHVYPERWEFTQQECQVCKGTGQRLNPLWTPEAPDNIPRNLPCSAQGCNRGYIVAGPYAKIMVRPFTTTENAGNTVAIPTPPAGYVEKDIDIIKLMDESIKAHNYDALAAINFEFLADKPLNQSGLAKENDADALNNTLHAIGEDIVHVMDNHNRLVAYWRYKNIYSFEDIDKMLPSIAVPEKFIVTSAMRTMDELGKSKTAKVNPVIISALERNYATTRFNNDPKIHDEVSLVLKLDPLPNITDEDKMVRLSNKGITLKTYVISSNIQEFIQRAINENKGFTKLDTVKQQEILDKYADEVIQDNETMVEPPPGPGDAGLDEFGNPIIPEDGNTVPDDIKNN